MSLQYTQGHWYVIYIQSYHGITDKSATQIDDTIKGNRIVISVDTIASMLQSY